MQSIKCCVVGDGYEVLAFIYVYVHYTKLSS